MSERKFKKETLEMLDIMIQHAEAGPSGFWVDDYEGCGNPRIFPEFAEGLKKGRLVQKQHYICPWNTAVLYGEGHGNIHTGCYYSCSFRDASVFPPQMLRAILLRFRKRMLSGEYDNLKHLKPLLTESEQTYIAKQQKAEKERRERQYTQKQTEKAKRAKALLNKYEGDKDIQALIQCHYGEKISVIHEHEIIDFSPDGMKDIKSGHPLSYDEYLDIQIRSQGKERPWFALCYYNFPNEFKGCIEIRNNQKICFQRIFVTGMYADDCSFFDGKEDHVWMDEAGFEKFEVGDCVSFYADVYRYVKTGHGKILDYGLCNPRNIEKIEAYRLPSDKQIVAQQIDEIICENCYLSEQCSRLHCMRNPKELRAVRDQMMSMVNKE